MPKDPAENQDQYKIGGGFLNEFEFQQNKGGMTEEEHQRFLEREGGDEAAAPPQTEAERIAQMMEDARVKAERNLRKREERERKRQPAKASAGKRRARGAKKAGAVSKAAAQKSGAKKGTKKAAKGATKRATKKATKKSSAGKAAGRKGGARAAQKRTGRR